MLMERQVVSADAFLELVELPEYADRRLELIEGEIVEMCFPNPIHSRILITLSKRIDNFAEEHGLGQVIGGDAPFVLEENPDGRDTLRGIDIAYLSFATFPGPLTQEPLRVPPDLAVEIILPSNTAADIAKKIQQLFDAGTELIWIVYPELRAVAVHTLDGAIMQYDEDDTLTGGDILPGFAIQVGEIFPS